MKGPNFRGPSEPPFLFLLEREWIAARLALRLNLPCVYPVQIRIDSAIIEVVEDSQLRDALKNGPEILFGGINVGVGWSEWSSAFSVPRNGVQCAAEIYLFDTMIQNWDRSVAQPNLLAKGPNLMMLDHGEAFVEATATSAERDYHGVPWHLGSIRNAEGADEFERHPLWSKLRPKSHVSFTDAVERWKRLPEDVFDLIAAEVPSCWDSRTAQKIADYLSEAVEKIDKILENIEHNFSR